MLLYVQTFGYFSFGKECCKLHKLGVLTSCTPLTFPFIERKQGKPKNVAPGTGHVVTIYFTFSE